jgi:hypothetical protein
LHSFSLEGRKEKLLRTIISSGAAFSPISIRDFDFAGTSIRRYRKQISAIADWANAGLALSTYINAV